MTEPGQEMVRAPEPKTPVPLSGPIADLDSAWRYAVALAKADILPQDLRGKPSNVLTVLLYGQYLGIPPVIATQVISVVKGRPQIAGKMLMAKVREAGHTPVVEHGDGRCTVTITRGDTREVHTESFSIQDAAQAGLCSIQTDGSVRARSQKGEPLPWENYTARMLMWRALGFCVDVICPEIKMGFAVEGEEGPPEPGSGGLAKAVAQRTEKPEPPAQVDPAAEVADIERQFTGDDAQPESPDAPVEAVIACCAYHREDGCCDPQDCSPCCRDCPTCPTEAAIRERDAELAAQQGPDLFGGGES